MLVFSVIVLAFALVNTHAYVILPKAFNRTGRVVNGYDAAPDEFPYVVMIEINLKTGRHPITCTGSLIGNTWVLTAAHCVDSASKVTVYLGVKDFDYAETSYTIWNINIKIHPDWDNEWNENDIALIRIPHTETCDKIKTVPLPAMATSYSDYVYQFATFSGWGQTMSASIPRLLQWVRLPVVPNWACWELIQGITSEKLCVDTGDDHRSPCFGDSGGPLVLQPTGELIGVFSTIANVGCDQGYPAVFIRVTSYLEWIKSVSGISY